MFLNSLHQFDPQFVLNLLTLRTVPNDSREVLPQILEMWGTNMMTDVASKKTKSLNEGNDDPTVPPALC